MRKTGRQSDKSTKALFVIFALLLTGVYFHANAEDGNNTPDRIILNLTDSPATSMAVTWRTKGASKDAQAQIATETDLNKVGKDAATVNAASEKVVMFSTVIGYSHSVVFKSLKPDTLYEYRVGDGENWSEWSQFRTAKETFAPFKFVFFGDPQNDIKSLCSRIFHAAYAKAPDARFWLFTGDIVNSGDQDNLWGELYYAFGWISRTTPMIFAPGNHEYKKTPGAAPKVEANKQIQLEQRALTPLWQSQFTLPENGPKGLEEEAYYIDYQNVRFVMLNGNELIEEQSKWLKKVLADNPQRWTIVAVHQPFFSTGEDRDNPYQRKLFTPIFDKYSVDLVLQGHDHTYGRTYKIRKEKKVADDENGTVYVVSVSGPKTYDPNKRFENIMVKMGTGRQLYQVISVDEHSLKYECFTVSGELYDSFELKK